MAKKKQIKKFISSLQQVLYLYKFYNCITFLFFFNGFLKSFKVFSPFQITQKCLVNNHKSRIYGNENKKLCRRTKKLSVTSEKKKLNGTVKFELTQNPSGKSS